MAEAPAVPACTAHEPRVTSLAVLHALLDVWSMTHTATAARVPALLLPPTQTVVAPVVPCVVPDRLLLWCYGLQEGKKRAVPGGPLFALVSCPNYTAEVLSWVGFSIMTQVSQDS